jgi:hypothetical protein
MMAQAPANAPDGVGGSLMGEQQAGAHRIIPDLADLPVTSDFTVCHA